MTGQRDVCACGDSIRFVKLKGYSGWVHEAPLGQMKVTAEEAELIKADPPLGHEPLHRETFLHQPHPVNTSVQEVVS